MLCVRRRSSPPTSDVYSFPRERARPSVRGFAKGLEHGGGGPGCFSLALTYEFRVARLFAIAPVAQVYGIVGENFDGFFMFFGLEFIKWFQTATG